MIVQAIEALRRSIRDPGYLFYFLRNVNVLRDHFPKLHRWWCVERKTLQLGEARIFSQLHVVLRTTDHVLNVNNSRDLEEMGIVSKRDVIRVGACSLFPAARKFFDQRGASALRITIVTDRLSEKGRRLYVDTAAKYAVPIAFVDSRGTGNGPSFQTQIDVALKDSNDTLALILEDDYLLSPETLLVAYDAFCRCSHIVGLNPHFHPGCVCHQNVRRFCVIGGRVYGRVDNTCCTFFMPIEAMRRHERELRRYDGWENGSINQIWRRELCLVPFGWTMAEHLHKQDLSPVFKKERIPSGQESPRWTS